MSDLRQRLARLRGQAPGPEPEPAAALRERLGQAGVLHQRRHASPPPDPASLAQRLGAEPLAPGLLCVDRDAGPLPPATAQALAWLGAEGRAPVYFDTETTGLAGGTGTLVFLLGLGYPAGDTLRLRQYLLTTVAGEAAMLAAAREFLAGFEVVVSYNGRSFDQPLVQTRARLHGGADPLAHCLHLDLLHPTRRGWAALWPDCRLQTVEQRLLGVRREDDLPGAEAPEAWFGWLRRGETRPLQRVVAHNAQDLLSLAQLLPRLEACYRAGDGDIAALARAQERLERGDEAGALALLCAEGAARTPRERHLLATLARRLGDTPRALAAWQALAGEGDVLAIEHLAKHAEHRLRDPAGALLLTRRLRALQPLEPRHRHREQRLLQRLGGGGADAEAGGRKGAT